jgi:D-aminopeptidase
MSAFRFLQTASVVSALFLTAAAPLDGMEQTPDRPRARDVGVVVGVFQPGPLNSITDVAGVRVGQVTVRTGDSIRTGVTAILPHGGNLYQERVPAAIHVGNGYGKLLGVTQVRELGELESPILLTCTLCVWRAADALVGWMLAQPGMERVRSINVVVGETNDGELNDIRARPIEPAHVTRALASATTGPVEEGSVGAGTGTVAFGWKGGIGTSSRLLPERYGGFTVGVLVQSNYGGILTIDGAPVGQELGQHAFREARLDAAPSTADGSIMIVVATDAPLDARQLERLASRAIVGLARTGATVSNGSGDYVIAFSTANDVRIRYDSPVRSPRLLANESMTPLFQAVAEATEEAIYNSLFRATTTVGHQRTVEALPLDAALDVLRRHRLLRED